MLIVGNMEDPETYHEKRKIIHNFTMPKYILLWSLGNFPSKSFFHVYIFSSLLDLNVHIILYTAFLLHYYKVL